MRNKTIKIISLLLATAALVFLIFWFQSKRGEREQVKEITPTRGKIQTLVSATGTVLPRNRLEVKPPVGGRIESILVKEGERVAAGETLAWMSSTERAALLDAARGKGEEELQYFQDTYKPIPLISPINGEVIVATTQPGQTVTTNDAVVVISDRLIVRAQVDETDIGKIKVGQKAIISLDAYPDTIVAIKSVKALPRGYLAVYRVTGAKMFEIDVYDPEGKFVYILKVPDEISMEDAIFYDFGFATLENRDDFRFYVEYRIINLPEIFSTR